MNNVHHPSGLAYRASLARLIDCPSCKYGTLDRKDPGMKCADCGKIFTIEELKERKILPRNFS